MTFATPFPSCPGPRRCPRQIAVIFWVAAVVAGSLALGLAPLAAFSPGDLDPTFGKGGRVVGPEGRIFAMAVQADGKLIAGGCTHRNCHGLSLARYLPGGSVDQSFGDGGRILTRLEEASNQRITDVEVLQDDKILVAGSSGIGAVLLRYRADGAPDPTFGIEGKVEVPASVAEAMARQPDGKIVVVGRSGEDLYVGRFTSDGGADPTFMESSIDLGGDSDRATGVVVQSSGRIIVSANAIAAGASTGSMLLGFGPSGAADETFGLAGRIPSPLSNAATLTATSSGQLIAAGRVGDAFGLAQFDGDGRPDTAFGNAGVVRGPQGRARTVVTSNGKLYAIGSSYPGDEYSAQAGTSDFVIAAFNSDGSSDATFGSGGAVATSFGQHINDGAAGALDSTGRLIAAGGTGRFGMQKALAGYKITSAPSAADVSLRLSDRPDPVFQAGRITYTIQVHNQSPGSQHAYGVKVSDTLSSDVRLVSANTNQGYCNRSNETVTCELGGLLSGESVTITLVVSALRPGMVQNTATVSTSSTDPDPGDNSAVETTEVRPAPGRWTVSGPTAGGAAEHTATLLDSERCRSLAPATWCGKVLVIGSADGHAYLYDPHLAKWADAGPVPGGKRDGHTATLLPDGKVLVAGGGPESSFSDRSDIYDPAQSRWQAGPFLNVERYGHLAVRLQDGRVLVAGGFNGEMGGCEEGREVALSSTEFYDPARPELGWKVGTSMKYGRQRQGGGTPTATVLRDGRVLFVGGFRGDAYRVDDPAPNDCDDGGDFAPAEVFDPEGNSGEGRWLETGDTSIQRIGHSATLLANGHVLVAGGNTSFSSPLPTSSVEIYDPSGAEAGRSGVWYPGKSLEQGRQEHSAALLSSGLVLVAGGRGEGSDPAPIAETELYDPSQDRWIPAGFLNEARYAHTSTVFPAGSARFCSTLCGRVLLVGGNGRATQENPAGVFLESTELYTLPPHVTRVEPAEGPVTGGTHVTVSGTGLAPISSVTFEGEPPLVCGKEGEAKCWIDQTVPDLKIHAISPPHPIPEDVHVVVETLPALVSAKGPADIFRYRLGPAPVDPKKVPDPIESGPPIPRGQTSPPVIPPSSVSSAPASSSSQAAALQALSPPPLSTAQPVASSTVPDLQTGVVEAFSGQPGAAGGEYGARLTQSSMAVAFFPHPASGTEEEPQLAPRHNFSRKKLPALALGFSLAAIAPLLVMLCFAGRPATPAPARGRAGCAI